MPAKPPRQEGLDIFYIDGSVGNGHFISTAVGNQLARLTLAGLVQCDIPVHWGEQRRVFGFS